MPRAVTPKDLDPAGSALWRSITGKYDLRVDEKRVLEEACRETDLIERLRLLLMDEPLMLKGSMGQPVVHPAVAELRQHRNVLASLLRSLKLPDDSADGAVNQQRQAGNASWASRGA
jgi:hypothetical protein